MLTLAHRTRLARMAGVCFYVLGLGCATNRVAAQATTNGCRSADPAKTPIRLGYFRTLVSSTDPDRDSLRIQLGLSSGSGSKVNLVTSQSTCLSAISALNIKRNEPDAIRRVWVVTLTGGDYAVEDPDIAPPGEYMPVYIFDRKFKFKSLIYPW